MILPQLVGVALLVAASFDPVDRALGAKPSTSPAKQAKQDEPGFWGRIKGRLFSHKSEDQPPQSSSRSGHHVSTAHSSATPGGQEKTVYSSVSLKKLLANRLAGDVDAQKLESKRSEPAPLSQEDHRPILDRLRSRLSWHKDKPAPVDSERRFAWSRKPKVEPNDGSVPEPIPELDQVPTDASIDPFPSDTAILIQRKDPDRASNLLTRVDAKPNWTSQLVSAPASREAADEAGGLPPGVAASDTAVPSGLEQAGPANPTVADDRSQSAGGAEPKEAEQTGPTLIDPNAATPVTQPTDVASRDRKPAEFAAEAPGPIVGQPHAKAAAMPQQSETAEPGKLELNDQDAQAKIAQTGFVRHAADSPAVDSSKLQAKQAKSAASGSNPANHTILSSILAPALCERLNNLPVECYPTGGLLLGSVLVILFSRGRQRDIAPTHAPVVGHVRGPLGWPVSMILPSASAANGAAQPGQPRGGLFGALTTTIGLAIIAVGGMAVLRAYAAQHTALMRPGVMIAAIGQFILLLGIVALTVQSRRQANARTGSALGLVHAEAIAMLPAVAGTVPCMPLGTPYAWQAGTPSIGGQGNQSGQIAQLKAQLACLSQQLDHLGTAENGATSKAA